MNSNGLILPVWPVPSRIKACITTRQLGVSKPPYASNNLALHVSDDSDDVLNNREALKLATGVEQWQWLEQVHGTDVVEVSRVEGPPKADASFTSELGLACVVLTADCLPILLTNSEGSRVAAIHAGWRSLAGGIIGEACKKMGKGSNLLAYFGPAIGPECFEVGEDVYDAIGKLAAANQCSDLWRNAFQARSNKPGFYLADIYQLARWQLAHYGVGQVYGGELCTVKQEELFYSYRRDGQTGRMASAIWIEPS